MTLPVWPAYSGDAPSRDQARATFNANMAAALTHLLTVLPDAADTWGADMVDALAAANYSDVSTTSNSIGTGAKTLTIQSGKMFVGGQFVLVADAAAPTTNYMFCQVTSYSGTSLVLNSLRVGGSGTKTAWVIGLSGPQGEGGDTLPAFGGNAYKSLRVNAGETAAEWVDDGYVLLETLSPSGAATSTSAAIPSTYSDLYVTFSGAITSGIGVALSADGAAFSSVSTLFPSVTATIKMGLRFNGYNFDYGNFTAGESDASSPGIATGNHTGYGWVCTGGINNLRFSNGNGNLTATIRIYGKK